MPHPPQFLGSLFLSTQSGGVPHVICVGIDPHIKHIPPVQLAVAPHAVPQVPQLVRSVLRSAQEPPVLLSPRPLPQVF